MSTSTPAPRESSMLDQSSEQRLLSPWREQVCMPDPTSPLHPKNNHANLRGRDGHPTGTSGKGREGVQWWKAGQGRPEHVATGKWAASGRQSKSQPLTAEQLRQAVPCELLPNVLPRELADSLLQVSLARSRQPARRLLSCGRPIMPRVHCRSWLPRETAGSGAPGTCSARRTPHPGPAATLSCNHPRSGCLNIRALANTLHLAVSEALVCCRTRAALPQGPRWTFLTMWAQPCPPKSCARPAGL